MAAPASIYVQKLEVFKFRQPIYNPEDQINVGDVGFFQKDSGGFRALFNVLLSADRPYHARFGVPTDYQPLRAEDVMFTVKSDYLPPQPIASQSVSPKAMDVEPIPS